MLVLLVASALSLQPGGLSRRELLTNRLLPGAAAALLPASAAHAVSARTGQSSPFTGEYDDPNHPGCLRSVKIVGAKMGPDGRKLRTPTAYVKGVDQTKGEKACSGTPELASVWKLEGVVTEDGETLSVDFAPKTEGRVGMLKATYDELGGVPGIAWSDGNKWTKVAGGTPDRRPPAVTLNSGE